MVPSGQPGCTHILAGAAASGSSGRGVVRHDSFKAAMELYKELDASNPDWKKIYADYRNFQRDQVLWFRFAESRFDNFMMGQKL